MKTLKFLLLVLRDLIVVIIIGTMIGYVAGIGFNKMRAEDRFVSWELLANPFKFAQIVDATTEEILASSSDGKLHKLRTWECRYLQKCNWMETSEKQLERDELHTTIRKDVCPNERVNLLVPQIENMLECIFTSRVATESSLVVYYAILDDGTIWCWYAESFYLTSADNKHSLNVSTLIGSVIGVAAGIVIIFRKEARSKYD